MPLAGAWLAFAETDSISLSLRQPPMAYYASLPASSTSASTSASPSTIAPSAGSSTSPLLLPVTRSRTGLFLSYRDTVIRAPSSTSGYGYGYGYSDKGKGRATYSDDYEEGDSIAGEESAGLLGSGSARAKAKGKGKGKGDRPHEVIQMDSLPPQW